MNSHFPSCSFSMESSPSESCPGLKALKGLLTPNTPLSSNSSVTLRSSVGYGVWSGWKSEEKVPLVDLSTHWLHTQRKFRYLNIMIRTESPPLKVLVQCPKKFMSNNKAHSQNTSSSGEKGWTIISPYLEGL